MKRFALMFIFLSSTLALAQALSSGNSFVAVPIYGDLTLECTDVSKGTTQTVQWSCEDERLMPVDHDYFVGPNVGADTVELNAINPKTHSLTHKVSSYLLGKSTTRFNLWLESVFQTPLLSEGTNHIAYALKQNATTVKSGTFDVQVSRGKTQFCAPTTIKSDKVDDCNNPATWCDQYFQQTDFCQ